MNLNVVWGPPAAGKSTYVRENRSENSLTFDFDMLMTAMSGLRQHHKNNNLIGYLLDIRELIIEKIKSEKRIDDAWIIITWVDEKIKEKFADIEDVNYILMDTDMETCLERVDNDPDRADVADEMKQVIKDWFDKFESKYQEEGGADVKGNRQKEFRAQGSNGLEFRTVNVEIRQENKEEGEPRGVAGLGLVYDRETELWPGYKETIRKDAFKESVERKRDRPIKSYFNHNPNFVLATTESDPPLVVNNTDEGVFYEAEIPETSYGRDLEENLRRKNVQGSSFAFAVDKDRTWEDEEGVFHREIIKGEIYELGPVTDPAYIEAPASLRSAGEVYEEIAERIKSEKKVNKKKREQYKKDVQELNKYLRSDDSEEH